MIVVRRTAKKRYSTCFCPRSGNTGSSLRDERVRPFHWPRRERFLTGPNMVTQTKGKSNKRQGNLAKRRSSLNLAAPPSGFLVSSSFCLFPSLRKPAVSSAPADGGRYRVRR